MHHKRLIVAAIVVPLLYLYVMFLPAEYFLFLAVFVSTIALIEFYAMFRIQPALKYAAVAWGAVLLAVFFAARHLFADMLLLAALTLMGLRLVVRRDPSSSREEISAVLMGLLYIPGLLTFQLDLVSWGPAWIVMLYVSVWVSDSMAYYIGKGFGKRKLYPEVSPNKTVAGGAGSLAGGVVGAVFVKSALLHQVPLLQSALLGLSVGAASIVGDLVESMLKRDAGIKDSSNILPGHGGMLDKLDSVTFAGPVFYWLGVGLGLLK
ncbi:MAG: phosphatidate cytidylyltransferase [Nitrospiraceae bacterium]|nr:phosphatidate cytidylyltransferase [Nitrospiraceae bacterium]